MQAYLQKPFSTWGFLGPAAFVPAHDADFYDAYFALLPYQVHADPEANPLVAPSSGGAAGAAGADWQALTQGAEFRQIAADVDQGIAPWDGAAQSAVADAVSWARQWSTLSRAVTDYEHTRHYSPLLRAADDLSLFSYLDVYRKNGRHCVGGHWESRASYVDGLVTSLNMVAAAHELGHSLGLRHNFMASVDQRNFPVDTSGAPTLYASSIMDYNQAISSAFFETGAGSPGWGPWDVAALAWIYGNDLSSGAVGPATVPGGAVSSTVSGQVSPTVPWNDPLGFRDPMTERPFLYCAEEHTRYTPLCRRDDLGATPSEIVANAIQQREWDYRWTNYRLAHSYFSEQSYAGGVANDFNELRRFTALWDFDWRSGALAAALRQLEPVPSGATEQAYYDQLVGKLTADLSVANQLGVSYAAAIVDQSATERSYVTSFDPYYGDVVRQGIAIDKMQAATSLTELWPAFADFDPGQSAGAYLASAGGQVGDGAYTALSQAALADVLGASFAAYSFLQLAPLAIFADATHSAQFQGDPALRSWVGGETFGSERDFLDYVHAIAVAYHFQNCDANGLNCAPCTSVDNCSWDPRTPAVKPSQLTQSDRNGQFQAPDGRTYIWAHLTSRDQWLLADKNRNVATYRLVLSWAKDVATRIDNGVSGASPLESKVDFAVDAFTNYGH
jgi:hypothetical protein